MQAFARAAGQTKKSSPNSGAVLGSIGTAPGREGKAAEGPARAADSLLDRNLPARPSASSLGLSGLRCRTTIFSEIDGARTNELAHICMDCKMLEQNAQVSALMQGCKDVLAGSLPSEFLHAGLARSNSAR